MTETQTGYQRRRAEQQIDQAALTASLAAVHKVGDAERAAAVVRDGLFAYLDLGERSLWAHALTRTDAWVLCGPDKASLRFGVRARLARPPRGARSACCMMSGIDRPAALRTNYTSAWLAKARSASS